MITLGLLGAPAAGKSTVADEFARLGAFVFHADPVVHRLFREPGIRQQLAQLFGHQVLTVDGGINRTAVAALVFGEDALARLRLRLLEKILHPLVQTELLQQWQEQIAGKTPVFVIDAPLLLEAGWSTLCQRLIYVDTPEEIRYHRAAARGWSSRDIISRERSQLSAALKKARADFVIDNSGSLEEVRQQVTEIWHALLVVPSSTEPTGARMHPKQT